MDIISQLKQIGFTEAMTDESINEIIEMKRTQLVATYHLLLSKKSTKEKKSKQKKKSTQFYHVKKQCQRSSSQPHFLRS